MPKLKHPGIYIEEIPTMPRSISPVATAVPAFIGYTVTASKRKSNDLHLTPTKVNSFREYCRLFGESGPEQIHLQLQTQAGALTLQQVKPLIPRQMMGYAIKLFFENGGQSCYIVSVGNDQSATAMKPLAKGIHAAQKIDEITLLLAPEQVLLPAHDYQTLVQQMLTQCAKLGDRMAILNLRDGDKTLNVNELNTNRAYFGTDHLSFGACYYPFLLTSQPAIKAIQR